MKKEYEVSGMTCQGCAGTVQEVLENAPAVKHAEVDLTSARATLDVDEEIDLHQINKLLHQRGTYTLNEPGDHTHKPSAEKGFWQDKKKWRRSAFNTLNCLIGCSIGDFGMIIFLQAYYPETSMMWQMILAIIAGLSTSIILETIIMKTREHFSWGLAFRTAIGMSFISMVAMEIAMNSTDFLITGGKAAFDSITYWLALIPAMIAGFLVPLPYNYYKLKKFNKACH